MRTPNPDQPSRLIKRLQRELDRASDCMRSVASLLDYNNIGRSKFRLIRGADRAQRAAESDAP